MKNMKWLLLLIVAIGIFACSKVEDPKTIVLLGEEKYVKDVADINHVFDSLYKYFDSEFLTGDSGYCPTCVQGEYKMFPQKLSGDLLDEVPDSIMFEFFDQHNRVLSCKYMGKTVDPAYVVGKGRDFRTYFTVGDTVVDGGIEYYRTHGVVITGTIDSLSIRKIRVADAIVYSKSTNLSQQDPDLYKWQVLNTQCDTAIRLDTQYPCY